MEASVRRKLDKRCAHRADGAPRSAKRCFRRSETMCGQGQDRTVDLPLFRRTLIPTELPDRGGWAQGSNRAAVLTGFEPATSTLTGWRALRLLYRTILTRMPFPRSQEHITDVAVLAASVSRSPRRAATRYGRGPRRARQATPRPPRSPPELR